MKTIRFKWADGRRVLNAAILAMGVTSGMLLLIHAAGARAQTATDTPGPAPGATDTPGPAPGATDTPGPAPGATDTPGPAPGATDTPAPAPGATDTPTPASAATDTPGPAPGATDTPTPAPGATDTPTPALGATATPMPATLDINHTIGAPGSFFTVTGSNFPPNDVATIRVNGVRLGTVPTGAARGFVFVFDTEGADPGRYSVTATVNPEGCISFSLDPDAPTRPPQGGGPVLQVPPNIALTEVVYLSLIRR